MRPVRGRCADCGTRTVGVLPLWRGTIAGVDYVLCWPCVRAGGYQRMREWAGVA